jgi:hypothetical protein
MLQEGGVKIWRPRQVSRWILFRVFSINNPIDIRFMSVQANVTMFRLTSGFLLRDSGKAHLPFHTRGEWSMHQISLADSDHGNILSVCIMTELRRGQCLQHSKERRRQSCRQCGNDNAGRRTHILFLNSNETGENSEWIVR